MDISACFGVQEWTFAQQLLRQYWQEVLSAPKIELIYDLYHSMTTGKTSNGSH